MRKNIRRAVLVALAFGILTGQAWADCFKNGAWEPFDDETLTVSTTALPLTATVYAPAGEFPAGLAVCSIESNPLRVRDNGLNPTSSVGELMPTGTKFEVCGVPSIRAGRYIRSGAADATLFCRYYR